MRAIQTLLRGSIDYAGLFPPASLDMAAAVDNYDRYLKGGAAWALGRFVVPVSRLPEFESAAAGYLPRSSGPEWRLATLAGSDLSADLQLVGEFNHAHAAPGSGLVTIDTIEFKASSERAIRDLMQTLPPPLQAYIEIPIDREPGALIAAIGGSGGRAKVRTGGVTGDAFPATAHLMRFLHGCVTAAVPFKATAGLHHALRAEYPLTYAPDSPRAPMFGFLNLFLTVAFLHAGMDHKDATRLLEEGSADAFQADERGITWRDHRLDVEVLRRARQQGLISFGSCSFTEPIEDLERLQLLDSRVQQA
ncbi:MAG: hypothetical protein ACREMZ_08865 [Gemmatimonadales bacterium]